MKLETAFEHIRIWSDGKASTFTLHISPEGDTTIERKVFIKEPELDYSANSVRYDGKKLKTIF